MMSDIIYRTPRFEHANNLDFCFFERRAVTILKRFVKINYFLIPVLSCKCFLVGFKAVYEPTVSQRMQRKEHVFQALTLE